MRNPLLRPGPCRSEVGRVIAGSYWQWKALAYGRERLGKGERVSGGEKGKEIKFGIKHRVLTPDLDSVG